MSAVYLPHVKLANVTAGEAEVRLFTPFSRDVAFGSSVSLGWVLRQEDDNRWMVLNADRALIGAHFLTRKAAIDHLVERAKNKENA